MSEHHRLDFGRSQLSSTNTDATMTPNQGGDVIREGWLYISRRQKIKWDRRYFVLRNKSSSLQYCKTPKEGAKMRSVSLFLTQVTQMSVKGQKHTFQLVSIEESLLLRAESQEDMNEWISALQGVCAVLLNTSLKEDPDEIVHPHESLEDDQEPARAVGDSNFKGIPELLQKNDICAECSQRIREGSAFVSLMIGCFLCKECALCHDDILGVEVSNVQSLQEDSKFSLFDPQKNPMAMTFLNHMGNKKTNAYWEASLSGYSKPTGKSSAKERRLWVKEKYIRKTFRGQKQGYLIVKRKEKKKSKKYWVVLESSTINIFNSKEDMKAQEIIVLQSCGVKVGDDPSSPESFTIITPGKTFKLQDTTFPAALEWANAIAVAAASLMKQLTNTANVSSSNLSKIIAPVDTTITGLENQPIQRLRSRQVRTEHNEWERTFNSILQLEEQMEALRIAYCEPRVSIIAKKIKSLQEQQFEVANVLLSLPAKGYKSQLDKIVKDSQTGIVTGGNVESLVEFLLTNDQTDVNFSLAWILTYRSFMTPFMFLCELAKQFNRKDAQTQQFICHFLESWICSHFYDLHGDGDSLKLLLGFVDNPISKSGMVEEANRFRSLIRNQVTSQLLPRRLLLDAAPTPIYSELTDYNGGLADMDDLEIARQLTLIDQKLFKAIQPREFLNLNWLSNDAALKSPNIVRVQNRFDEIVRWVLTSIAKLDKPKRPIMLSKFIQIAKHCKDLRNFSGYMQIMTAIEDTILLQFDGTWEGLSQKYVPILLELRKLIPKARNFRNLRVEMEQKSSPCVPHLPLFLHEIEEIEQNEPNFIDKNTAQHEMLNFSKFRTLAKVLSHIQQFQAQDYILHPVPAIQTLLWNIQGLTKAELSALTQMTRFREELLGLHSFSDSLSLQLPSTCAPVPQ